MTQTVPSKKTGLVLGGGGSRGSYEAGVCQALNDLNMHFDVVTGTSIGGLVGALYTQQDISGLKAWINTFKQDMVAKNLFMFPNQYNTESLAGKPIDAFLDVYTQNGPSIDPLKQEYGEVFNYDQFMNSPIQFGVMTYNVTQNTPEAFVKNQMTSENVLDILMASAAYFPAFNLVNMNGNYYLDGGYADTVPVDLAISLGAEDIYAVDLSDPGVNKDVPADKDITLFRPLLRLKYYLDFDGQQLDKQVTQGYLETLKYMDKAPGYLYTFYPDDWAHMKLLEKVCMEFLLSAGKVSLLEELPAVMKEIYQFLLGYVPEELHNKYSGEYVFGQLLEVIGIISGVDLYQQIHFHDFVKEILNNLNHLTSNPNNLPQSEMFNAMEMKGLKDFMVFFHSALISYDSKLPDSFKVFEQGDYILPYYLAWGWHLIEKFKLAFIL